MSEIQGKETEHNWLDREKSVIRLRGMVSGDVHERYPDAWFTGLKGGILEGTIKAVCPFSDLLYQQRRVLINSSLTASESPDDGGFPCMLAVCRARRCHVHRL